MNEPEKPILVDKIRERIDLYIKNDSLSNENLVQIIEHCGDYLNLRTISNYAKEEGISYNGAKKCRSVKVIFGCSFVIDNR